MSRAPAVMAALLAAAAMAAGCSDEADDQEHVDDIAEGGMFGPSEEYEDHTVALMTADSDKELADLCEDLGAALSERGHLYWADAVDVPGDDGCGYLTADLGDGTADLLYSTGAGAAVPTRLHAWTDADGTHLAYFDPAPLTAAVDASDEATVDLGVELADELAELAAEVAGSAPEPGEPVEATYTTIPSELEVGELDERLAEAGQDHGLRLLDVAREDSAAPGGTHVFAIEGEGSDLYADLYETSPAIGVANPVQLHVWADEDDNAVVSYFDPAPLFRAVDDGFGDAGFDGSTIVSDVVWQAAAAS